MKERKVGCVCMKHRVDKLDEWQTDKHQSTTN